MNAPMDPQAAMALLDQLGINVADLPRITAAAQAIAAASQGAQAAPLRAGGEGSVLGGRPGANNDIPNPPAGQDGAQMMRELFSTDRNRRAIHE